MKRKKKSGHLKKGIAMVTGLFACVLMLSGMAAAKEKNGISYDFRKGANEIKIDDILQADRVLQMPEVLDKCFVTSIQLDSQSKFVTVKRLILPAQLKKVEKCRASRKRHGTQQILEMFPNLEEVKIAEGNSSLCTDGDAIYSKDKTVLYSLRSGVEEYEIPASVQEIKTGALTGAKKLRKITVQTGNTKYKVEDGVLFTRDGKKLILMPPCLSVEDYQVPNSVANIEERAFERQRSLSKVHIPGTVDVIGEAAFEKCSHLRSVTIGDGVRKIGDFAFFGSWEMTEITLGEGVQTIGEAALEGTDIRNLTLPSTLERVAYRNANEPELPLEQLNMLIIKSPYLSVRNFYYIGELAEYPIVYAVKNSDAYRLFRKVTKVYALPGAKAVKRTAKKDKEQRKKENQMTKWYYKTKEKVCKIRTPEQLMSLSIIGREDGFWGETFVLENDIDMKKYPEFKSIEEFDGVFDGNGKKIKNLRIHQPGEDEVGLFASLEYGAKVKNLTVEGTVTGRSRVGMICGTIYGKSQITGCKSKGTVSGMSQVGGIVGQATGKSRIRGVKSTAKICANYFAGGILGYDASAKQKNLGRVQAANEQDVRAIYRYAGTICSNADKR